MQPHRTESIAKLKESIVINKITQLLKTKKILVSDGAWGTCLMAKGLRAGECPELWNIERRSDVLDIAQSYINAGSDMIETNSFGGNSITLKGFGLDRRAEELNIAAAEISREAAGDSIVLGSIGPTGKMLITGDITKDEIYDVFSAQAAALEKGGADAIIIETMSDIEEAALAVKAAKDNTTLEIICTMGFDISAGGSYHTMMGVTPADFTNIIVDSGADIIGANCGNGIDDMTPIAKEIRRTSKNIPILIHANAGKPEYENGAISFPDSPSKMASAVVALIKAGTNIVGGCCGTTPEHIVAIKNIISDYDFTQ